MMIYMEKSTMIFFFFQVIYCCYELKPFEAHKRDRLENLQFQPKKTSPVIHVSVQERAQPGDIQNCLKKVHFWRE